MSLRKMSRNEAKNKTNQTLKHAHAFVATHFILRLRLFFFFAVFEPPTVTEILIPTDNRKHEAEHLKVNCASAD